MTADDFLRRIWLDGHEIGEVWEENGWQIDFQRFSSSAFAEHIRNAFDSLKPEDLKKQ